MSEQSPQEKELAELIVSCLDLDEDVSADEIDPQEALFGEGLGLDSIDALEIALAVSQKYGVEMQAEDDGVKEAFASLRTLCEFIHQSKAA